MDCDAEVSDDIGEAIFARCSGDWATGQAVSYVEGGCADCDGVTLFHRVAGRWTESGGCLYRSVIIAGSKGCTEMWVVPPEALCEIWLNSDLGALWETGCPPWMDRLERAQTEPCTYYSELDRTDEAFEAFLLEILSDFQVTVPELGTIKAEEPPIVIITTNRTREIHDALKRRCLYHWVDYPNAERELEIVRRKVPQANKRLSDEVVRFVQKLRQIELFKVPGVAETIDWAGALTELDKVALDPETVSDTIGVLLKYQDDIARLQGSEARRLLDEVKASLPPV